MDVACLSEDEASARTDGPEEGYGHQAGFTNAWAKTMRSLKPTVPLLS